MTVTQGHIRYIRDTVLHMWASLGAVRLHILQNQSGARWVICI